MLWDYERRDERAGTLHETIQTLAPPVVAAIPAHYWEDALRHSVYLSLVRDKIDQLIAKGDVISPDSKPDEHASKEVDDHDLWEKIKTAPFDRVPEAEHASYGDVTIMAKGRLMEETGGFRFTEDETNKDKCSDEKCREGVKAFWSVKRVRQREAETSPGRYHYELTFSVISQLHKKQRKPYENPARTFTVWESDPNKVVEMPQEHRGPERIQPHTQRPQRAIWVHRNIKPRYINHSHQHGLERLFSSLFADEDYGYEEPRYRPVPHLSPHSQHSKAGYVSSPSDQQKRLTPYPYKTHNYKYSRPLPPPPHPPHYHHSYSEIEGYHAPPTDHRYSQVKPPIRPNRPGFLPTPPASTLPTKNWTGDDDGKKSNSTDHTTRGPEIVTVHYSKPRPGAMKVSYLPDHVRPPIYNAPPGVFVTMDKKPFKPMPPLKLITKPAKSHKPIDFRPSPQVLDLQQFSEPDPLFDTAFRPITWNYSSANTTEKSEVVESSTQHIRKSTTKGKKPPKKHENIKSQIITTTTPEIITASQDSEESEDMEWANIVGAFAKTTPMASDNKNETASESTTSAPSSTTKSTTSTKKRTTSTTETAAEATTSTTPRPPKRTRPPHKFNKSDKIKKHKRTTTTTTNAPASEKSTQDLTPQASSSTATKPNWSATTKAQSTTSVPTSTTSTTMKPTTTTTRATTTTTTSTPPPTSTSTEGKVAVGTTQPKTKNRFRQSTLMQKGTSVNHDKWSSITTQDKTRPMGSTSKYSRRKGSNFQGYVSTSTQRNTGTQDNKHENPVTTAQSVTTKLVSTTEPTYEDYENNRETEDYFINQEEELIAANEDTEEEKATEKPYQEQETRDHSEFIFQTTAIPNDRTNEIVAKEEESITTEEITTSPPKNRTKCKKRKPTTEAPTEKSHVEAPSTTTSITTTSTNSPTSSFFDDLFSSFTASHKTDKKLENEWTSSLEPDEQESENHAQFVKIDDDLQDFLDSIGEGKKQTESPHQYEDEDDESPKDIKDSPVFEYEDDDDTDAEASARDSDRYDYHERPYSLLELMEIE